MRDVIRIFIYLEHHTNIVYSDTQFQILLKNRLGSEFEKIPMNKKGPGSKLMIEFETEKRAYGSGTANTKPRYLTLNVPDNAGARISDGEFELRECVR